jgi:8-oxo-dGTP diphosphatase
MMDTMQAADQGTGTTGKTRYQVIPRTLIFLTGHNPQSGAWEVLLLKSAPTKRLWANRYNGLGGHVEAREDIYEAALREVREETGLPIGQLTLRGIVNIHTGSDQAGLRPGVLLFVFHGESPQRTVQASVEGLLTWIPVAELAHYPLVDDLYELIPRTLQQGALFYGHYHPQADGDMVYRFG